MTKYEQRECSFFKDMLFIPSTNFQVSLLPFIPKSPIGPRKNTAHYKTYPLHHKKL